MQHDHDLRRHNSAPHSAAPDRMSIVSLQRLYQACIQLIPPRVHHLLLAITLCGRMVRCSVLWLQRRGIGVVCSRHSRWSTISSHSTSCHMLSHRAPLSGYLYNM